MKTPTTERERLDLLAAVLEYPSAETPVAARRLAGSFPSLAAHLERLARFVESDPTGAEERYTRLFDLMPKASLHVGYHLFGEDYARGRLLAELRREMHARGLHEALELPDYLPNLLRLLGRVEDEEDRWLLLTGLLRPGLEKITEALARERDPYSLLLRALPGALEMERRAA